MPEWRRGEGEWRGSVSVRDWHGLGGKKKVVGSLECDDDVDVDDFGYGGARTKHDPEITQDHERASGVIGARRPALQHAQLVRR